jgi:hypothetical protein
MSTALDIIASSLRLINVTAAGEPVDIATANDALKAFQDMVDSWNAERNTIFTTASQDFPLTVGQQSYTLGPSGNFNVARPAKITGMSAIVMTNPPVPVEEPIDILTVHDWQTQYPVKNVNGAFPLACYDDGGFPLRTLNFWPIPTQAGNKVRIYSWQALSAPAALNTSISFPPGYSRAFRYNLALELAAEFAAPVPATVKQIATQSLAAVKTMNLPELKLDSDLVSSPAGYNYKADLFGLPY